MTEVVIIDGVRTPIGKFGGGLSSVRPDDLLSYTYKALAERTGIDPAELDEVFAGCGNQAGEDNRDVARMSLLLAGFPQEVPGITVNRNCSSALGAVNLAARSVLADEGSLYIGSGVESMSRAPWSMPKPDKTPTTAPAKVYDTTVGWRYENPKLDEMYTIISLGEGAELIAEEMQISREEQDAFALESHSRAVAAINAGKFKDEIIPVGVPQRRGDPILIDTDEHPRYTRSNGHLDIAINMDDLGRLRPAFKKDGSVTAGNSSGINDGAAALLMCSREKAEAMGKKPLLRWMGSASAGTDPRYFGYGPVPATEKLLDRFNLKIEDIGLVELNEAFAAQAIGCMRRLGLSHDNTNVNGGAIALGHPTGCSGARILVTLMHEMKRRAADMPRPFFGLATLCVGVGMGESTLVEWIGD
ncbi:MAG: thiolase family protein [Rhodospirillaceae bacterium]